MSRNIKEIGKELLGKSLNSYHRRTGLTQLEENNKMQDGILDGILSQVDDAYIEKTEQSNVIHLDGSGDGVVVLDSIEGNTMVNLIQSNYSNMSLHNGNSKENDMVVLNGNGTWQRKLIGYNHILPIKPNTNYTVVVDIISNTLSNTSMILLNSFTSNLNKTLARGTVGRQIFRGTTISELSTAQGQYFLIVEPTDLSTEGSMKVKVMIFEGHIDDDKIPSHIFGLQSSFEEQVEDNKYKIEILSNNRNLCNNGHKYENWTMVAGGQYDKISNGYILDNSLSRISKNRSTLKNLKNGETYTISFDVKFLQSSSRNEVQIYLDGNGELYGERIRANGRIKWTFVYNSKYHNIGIYNQVGSDVEHLRTEISNIIIEKTSNTTNYIQQKHNKIKLLINEPLRSAYNKKDKLCVKNGKLIIERWLQENIVNGTENWSKTDNHINSNTTDYAHFYSRDAVTNYYNEQKCLSDKFIWEHSFNLKEHNWINNDGYNVCILKNKANTVNEFKTWLSNNNIKVISVLREPIYEEVLNEYGEPILLEGYENGTLYIDSTIVPTTTVRYTPKMESFKTLKEVNNNNIMLTNDVNDNIIPYMMDVDLMIMEKEMALPSKANIRRIGAKDMTSMQKRTQDMLERLIKGKTLTEQECKTRVAVYLNAGKITDEQAEELNFLIDEIYA